jgi:hypothetical protein
MADNLQYIAGYDEYKFIDAIDHELQLGWIVKTIDRTPDREFYAFLEFPRS